MTFNIKRHMHARVIFRCFPWALGCGYLNPVVWEYTLESSFYRIFPAFWNSYILEVDDGGSLFKYFMYFLLATFVSVGPHVPRHHFFHLVRCDGARNPKV